MQRKRTKSEIEYCKYLSQTIIKLQKETKKTLNGLAFDGFMAPSSLCRIEKNQNTPLITNVAQIAYGLGIPLSELIMEMEKILPKDLILMGE